GMAARPAFQLRFFVWRLKIVHRTRAMPASTSQRRTKPKVRRNSDVIPINASWVSSQFGKLLEDLEMPHIRFHDLRHTAATNMHQLTGDFYTVGEVLGHTLAGIGASLGLSMNFEAVTARYVDVRLERKKEVLDAYHGAVEKAAPAQAKEAGAKTEKGTTKKKHKEMEL
ncbi:tyrosine-type recombinase/integrase, partial [Hominenteromicrobium sp.]